MFRLIKTYHQCLLNNLMKLESLEFKLYFDGVFFGILAKYFSLCKVFTTNKKWLCRPEEINHFSGNSIQFLDLSYLLSVLFLLDDAFVSPAHVVFPTALQKQQFRLL